MDTRDCRSLHIDLIEALADSEGVDAMELDYCLHDYIDPDAVDALAAGTDGDWSLRFTVADHTVTVDSDAVITVDGDEYRPSEKNPATS